MVVIINSRCFVVLAALVLFASGDQRASRVKRRLVFLKGTKFFLRFNIKENVFPTTTRLAWAIGFKMTYDLPIMANQLRFRRRAIYEDVEHVIHQNGYDGRACLLRVLCEAAHHTPSGGGDMFMRILKHIFTVPDYERSTLHPYHVTDDCETLADDCPISLFQIMALSGRVGPRD